MLILSRSIAAMVLRTDFLTSNERTSLRHDQTLQWSLKPSWTHLCIGLWGPADSAAGLGSSLWRSLSCRTTWSSKRRRPSRPPRSSGLLYSLVRWWKWSFVSLTACKGCHPQWHNWNKKLLFTLFILKMKNQVLQCESAFTVFLFSFFHLFVAIKLRMNDLRIRTFSSIRISLMTFGFCKFHKWQTLLQIDFFHWNASLYLIIYLIYQNVCFI